MSATEVAVESSPAPVGEEKVTRETYIALIAMSLGVFLVACDFTALGIALPSMQKDFGVDVGIIQWAIGGYALVAGVLIVTGGRLADLFGRRKVFFIGSGIFGLFSLLSGLAPNAATLIGARALMGIGGALMWPAVLGMAYAILPRSKAGFAGGLIIGIAGIGNAFGPIMGGGLTELLSWRWIFLVNVPIVLIACWVIRRNVKAIAPSGGDRRIDYLGIGTISTSLLALLIALTEVTYLGWTSAKIIGLLLLSVALGLAFIFAERRAGEYALIPKEVFGNAQFRAICIVVMLISAVFFAALLYVPLAMDKLMGYSPMKSGVALLPWLGIMGFVSFIAGGLYKRLGPKLSVSVGALGLGVGALLFAFVDGDAGYASLLPGMIAIGVGCGLFYSAATTTGVTVLDEAHASLAGGVVYMFQIVGGTIGLGLATTIFQTQSKKQIADEMLSSLHVDALHEALDGTLARSDLLAHSPDGALTSVFTQAFASGVSSVYLLVGLLAMVGVAMSFLFVGGRLGRSRSASGA